MVNSNKEGITKAKIKIWDWDMKNVLKSSLTNNCNSTITDELCFNFICINKKSQSRLLVSLIFHKNIHSYLIFFYSKYLHKDNAKTLQSPGKNILSHLEG